MRLSLLASACTSAVLSAIFTLPLLAQPVPKDVTLKIAGSGRKSIQLHCKDMKDVSKCIDGVQGLSPKEKNQLTLMAPKLQKQIDKELSKVKDGSGTCFKLRVYEYPKGFPEGNAKARPKISDCTGPGQVKELNGAKVHAYVSGQ